MHTSTLTDTMLPLHSSLPSTKPSFMNKVPKIKQRFECISAENSFISTIGLMNMQHLAMIVFSLEMPISVQVNMVSVGTVQWLVTGVFQCCMLNIQTALNNNEHSLATLLMVDVADTNTPF